jgi:hypothetical protein
MPEENWWVYLQKPLGSFDLSGFFFRRNEMSTISGRNLVRITAAVPNIDLL